MSTVSTGWEQNQAYNSPMYNVQRDPYNHSFSNQGLGQAISPYATGIPLINPRGIYGESYMRSQNDSKNIERILTLHPIVRLMARKHLQLCDTQNIHLRITHGERTFAEQDLLYAQGRTMPGKIVTNAKGGQSWHNFCLAYDVVPLTSDGKANWDTNDPVWSTVITLGKQAGMEHGIKVGNWIDMPHFQHRLGDLTIAEARDLYKRGILHTWKGVI